MLRRAMHDARIEASRENGQPNTSRPTESARRIPQEELWPRDQSRTDSSRRMESTNYGSAPAAQATKRSEESKRPAEPQREPEKQSRPTREIVPWHHELLERFFAAPPPKDPLTQNGRLYFVLLVFLCAFLAVVGKLFKVQVLDHNALAKAAQSQYRMQETIPAARGVIRDRNGVILATNAFVIKFAVDPKSIQDRPKLAALFAETFHKPVQSYLAMFRDTSRQYIVVEKDVPQEVAQKLDSVKDRGLLREAEPRRQYAFESRASHVIGFAGRDDRGLAGIELLANRELSGQNGYQIMERDGRGIKRPDVDYESLAPKNGEDITLTIDESIQSFTESALKAGVAKANAEAGLVIVMRPKTGEILALANAPDFDPNHFGKATNDDLRDRAITDAFEPGSIIKVITAAAALEDGVMKPDDKIYAEGGRWKSDGATFIDTHEYGELTFRGALEKSSNISFAKISDKLDRRRFFKYLRDFGLGGVTGIDLPGEIKGYVRKPDRWGTNSKRYMAFGYELTATAIQMASAYSTIANMGIVMKPYVIMKRTAPDGTAQETHPQEIRRVVSEATCRTLIGMMRGVVDSGTATTAKIKGIAIAGKTGTAQQLVAGHYSKEHYTSSFAGFFPAENPEYMILVILRSPHNGYYGGAVSAPIWREIAMHLLESEGKLPPEARTAQPETTPRVDEGAPIIIDGTVLAQRERQETRELPEVRGMTAEAGRSLLASQGFIVVGAHQNGVQQGMIEKLERAGGDSVRLQIDTHLSDGAEPVKVNVPDFVKLPMARAMQFGALNGVRTKLVGQGTIKRQFPEPGISVDQSRARRKSPPRTRAPRH